MLFAALQGKHLSGAQRKVARYIVEHYEEAIFHTARDLSGKVGVSEATVIRLAQRLGYNGYPAMQKAVREDMQNRLSTVARLVKSIQNAQPDDSILSKVMQQEIQNLTLTLSEISLDAFEQAVRSILEARRIFVIGLRGAHAPALILGLYLRYLKMNAHLVTPGFGDVWNSIHDVGDDDLVIGISFSRYSRVTVEAVEFARERGARVGAITDSYLSPLAAHADWVLTARSHLDSFIESFTAAMGIVNGLLTALSVKNPEETVKVLKDREALWKSREIYLSDDHRPPPSRPGTGIGKQG